MMQQRKVKIVFGLIGCLMLGGMGSVAAIPGPITSGPIADGTEIESSGATSGIWVQNGSTTAISGGNDIKITHTNGTTTSEAIRIDQGGGADIIIGDRLEIEAISTGGGTSSGIASNESGRTITIGDDARILATSDGTNTVPNAKGVFALDGKVNIGENANITVEGYRATGIYGWTLFGGPGDGIVNVDSGLLLTVDGTEAIAVGAANDGVVNLHGGTITATGTGSHALRTGSTDYDPTRTGGTINGTGVFQITGDSLASKGGVIDLTLQNQSTITGELKATDSGSEINIDATESVIQGNVWSGYGGGAIEVDLHDHSQLIGNLTADNGDLTITAAESTLQGDVTSFFNGDLQVNLQNHSQLTGNHLAFGGEITVTAAESILQGDLLSNNGGILTMDLQNHSQIIGQATATGGTVNIGLTDSGWTMTGDSGISTLTMSSGGEVAFATNISGGTYGTLTMDTLAGSDGLFHMRGDIANLKNDLLVIGDSGSGAHRIDMPNQGSANVTGNERLTLVNTTSGSATFASENTIELGGYQYQVRQNPDNPLDWELYGRKLRGSGPSSSHPADAGVNIFSGVYLLNYAEMNTLMQRMGELREENSKGNVWARTYGGKFDRDGDGFLRGFDMSYWGLQVGADKKLARKNGNIYVGGMFGYSDGSLDYERGSGSIDSKSIGAYGTYAANNGFYADLVLKYNWMKGDFRVRDSQDALVKAKDIRSDGFQLRRK